MCNLLWMWQPTFNTVLFLALTVTLRLLEISACSTLLDRITEQMFIRNATQNPKVLVSGHCPVM